MRNRSVLLLVALLLAPQVLGAFHFLCGEDHHGDCENCDICKALISEEEIGTIEFEVYEDDSHSIGPVVLEFTQPVSVDSYTPYSPRDPPPDPLD